MKTTIELPDDLFRKLKMKAAEESRSMKDLLTDLLRRSLSIATEKRQKKTASIPMVKGGKRATPEEEMTPERVAQILWSSAE